MRILSFETSYINFINSQRMNKNREVVLENPFHPLDLAPRDLLTIYKRFEESRIINRNPKQELPIQVISQLISSLKGCPPSYIQKCISQALIKQTISWNQFLTFLDQESEVRQKILQWLMYQKTTIRYKEEREWPYRSKINSFFEEITFLKYIESNQQDKLVLVCVDKVKFYLFSQSNGKINIIDCYQNKSERSLIQRSDKSEQDPPSSAISKIVKNQPKPKNKNNASKSFQRVQPTKQVEKAVNIVMNSAQKMPENPNFKEDEDLYYRKERKNINSLFNIFRQLDIDNGIRYVKAIAPKINDKSILATHVSQLKEIYSGGIGQQKNEQKKTGLNIYNTKPLDVAYGYLKELHRQKRGLSYNPYSYHKSGDNLQHELPKFKKIIKQRKSKEYIHQSNNQIYNDKLRCFAIIFFNMQLALVKLAKEFNKVSLQFQDKIRINTQNQHKKNQIIEAIDFYYHTIVDKWFLIVLIRVQYKNQLRNGNQSYLRGYQIQIIDNKRKTDKNYKFKQKKQAFSFQLGYKDKYSFNQNQLSKNQVFKMLTQTQFGIHFITVDGKYLCFKEDYIERQKKTGSDKLVLNEKNKKMEDIYFSFYYEEKFKNAGLSLSCLALSMEFNKMVFGSIRGTVIIYDVFSHFFKLKKVSNSQIIDIKICGAIAYILTLDQKLVLLDLVKVQQIQNMSVRNENKLHQKIKRFQLFKNVIYFYGSEVRSYFQYIDEKMQHQSRKMQTIYKWRLDRLFKQEDKFYKHNQQNSKEAKRLLPRKQNMGDKYSNIEIVLEAQSYFLVLTQILQLIVIQKKNLKIKFTLILGIPHDSKVMKMAFSQNQKLLALLLFNQNIFIFNIYTQDQYQHIKPSPFFKYTSLTFLDLKNEYLLANGTQSGKLLLSPYNTIPQKNSKVLSHHKKPITVLVVVKNQYLVSCGQDMLISIWLLPFNILKHQIKLGHEIGVIYEQIGSFKELLYLKVLEGGFIEINAHQGKLLKHVKNFEWTCSKLDLCTGQIIGISKKSQLQVLKKTQNQWKKVFALTLDTAKNEIKQIGLIKSQKAIIFLQNGSIIPWSYQNQKIGKIINLCKQ